MLLIENGYMINPKSGNEGYVDILVEENNIVKMAPNLRSALSEEVLRHCDVMDAEGLVIGPGLVDVHVHFREPGFTDKEDIASGSRAAAKGGFTTVVLMGNTAPPVDNKETLLEVLEKGKAAGIRVESCGNVTKGMKGTMLTDMKALALAGAVGFTDDGVPILDVEIARKAMEMAAELNMPISFHEEDPVLIVNNGIHKGKASAHYGVGGSPREAEISMIQRDLELALETGACINIQHISTKEGVDLVREAKKKGNHIHAEATPHHFTLTEDAIIQYGTYAKMNPPLREEEDRQGIIQGLKDGTIDLIATDHAPHTKEEKSKALTEAPSGIIGLETALSLGITGLVKPGHLTLMELLGKMSTNPAKMYHLDAGYLEEGGPADMVLFSTDEIEVPGNYLSKGENTPFTGWELQGVVYKTICKGQVVYENTRKVVNADETKGKWNRLGSN